MTKNLNDSLNIAVHSEDIELSKNLIERGADVNSNELLCNAVWNHCSHDVIGMLVKNGADVNAATKDSGLTPLHRAVINQDYDLIKFFIENGANVNQEDLSGDTALAIANQQGGNTKIISLLVNAGAK